MGNEPASTRRLPRQRRGSAAGSAGLNSLVVEFAEIDADALARVGGKAMNLGALTRAGLPVPPGISVTTDAYHQVAASAGPTLEPVFDALASTSSTDTARLARLAAQARAALLAAPVPDNVVKAIAEGYARLGANVPVAVRSSATAEDLPFASFEIAIQCFDVSFVDFSAIWHSLVQQVMSVADCF